MSLPHFTGNHIKIAPDPIFSSHFDVVMYTSLGSELENLTTTSINIDEIKDCITIKSCINSSSEAIADYKTLSTIKYIYFRIYDRNGETLKGIVYNVSLMGVQCKFGYSLDNSIQESDCTFNVYNSHNLDDEEISPDDVIKMIIRGEKINNMLD